MRILFPATIELDALPEGDGEVQSWAQVLRVGRFKLGENGPELNVTQAMLDEMVQNSTIYNEAPFDFEHFGTNGKGKAGDGKAAGWAKQWERRGDKLYALVSWTAEAADLIRKKAYRYVSATFLRSFYDPEKQKAVGARLLGAAITNYPFVQGMDPLALASIEDLSLTDREQRIAQAWERRFNPLGDFGVGYISAFYDDYVIVKKDGKTWKLPFEIDEQLQVTFPSEAVEVVLTPQELSMPEAIKPEDFAALQQQVASLSTQLTTTQAAARADQEKTAKLELALETANKEIALTKATSKVDKLIDDAKLLPKQREWALGYAQESPVQFDAFAATLEPQVRLDTEEGSAEGGKGKKVTEQVDGPLQNTDKAVVQFDALIKAHMKENPKLGYGAAMREVAVDNPDAYRAYTLSFRNFIGDDAGTVQ